MTPARAALRFAAAAACAAAGLAGCAPKGPQPPADPGVCWHMTQPSKGKYQFHKVAAGVPNLETCAANLEALRIHFLQMGGSHTELTGAYQGVFIFVEKEGIFSGNTLKGAAYLALVRSGDGRLVVPGAAPRS